MDPNFKPKITVFHCINIFYEGVSLPGGGEDNCELHVVKLPCSGMVKDIVLLKAFEAGADAVVVLVCPEEQCRHVQGSIRARKRVEWVQKLLDEIGLDGRRLSIFNIPSKDEASVAVILRRTFSDLAELGPNPAA
ncbi:MAG: hydrogenase iron-sulfur subunit [Pseudomonadota bacterium]|uniref:Hydrogenase iron-sulfur subunit n=1 Tax=Candidatus Desulfatibia profunda TaxID=2841695 RepID=A0A8J6TL23_9BACT|nr:hydrogenase iron-sulfur subunit [Candidatus Desulfatibia profunda]MBL7179143.1 hydrogenase iron-sulfur subunit [Desulfobacterales bacterium]